MVEAIRPHRFTRNGNLAVIVKWQGYDDNENTEEFLHRNPSIRRCKAFHDYCQSRSDLSEFSKDIEVFQG
jgi:hypothetical protein